MYQALVYSWGEIPRYTEVSDLPKIGPDELRVQVEAVAIHRVVRSRASGKHYLGTLPHIPGIDGVGRTEDGKQVYFITFGTGVLSQYINISRSNVFPLPAGVDPIQVAASINPAMSSWMAFKTRTTALPANFTCLIIGATSASGRLAIPFARSMGARKVIGAGRNPQTLDTLELDSTIVIADDPEETDFSSLDDVDVVLDYVYGPLALHLFNSLKTPKPVQYVEIGALSAQEIVLPGSVLRSRDITIRGSAPGAWRVEAFTSALSDLLAIVPELPKVAVRVAALADVASEWNHVGTEKLVLIP